MIGSAAQADAAVRLKDLASVHGVRHNQLIGYGLVIGLDGTGDGRNTAFTTQSLVNIMQNMGMQVDADNLRVQNIASVMITANLPPFAKKGQTIDLTLSSIGDASSLKGGTLLVTPLKGLDNQIYVMAQGAVSIGGFEVEGGDAAGRQKNHLTVARIPDGGTVEREVPVSFLNSDHITLSLNSPDFTTVSRMVNVIDAFLGGSYSAAVDGATVQITVPEKYRKQEIALLAAIENLEIIPDAAAKVVINERTGTVVMGQNVRIKQLALSHGNLSLQITPRQIRIPDAEELLASPPTEELLLSPDMAAAGADNTQLVVLPDGVTLKEVVRALNSVGVAPRDLIAILQSIKAAGALKAELEII